MNNNYVYRHIRLDKNIPFYIGVGSGDTFKRANAKSGRNTYWKNICNKHGYKVEILIENLNREDASKKEKEFINIYGRLDINTGSLCNLTAGGDNDYTVSQITKDKIAIWHTGIKQSQTTINKRVAKNKGKKRSLLFKEKMRQIHLGSSKPWKGMKRPEISEGKKQKVLDKTTGKIYDSVKEFSISCNFSQHKTTNLLKDINSNFKKVKNLK